ncbi:RsmE family RNA methyltransferase, partial [Pseudomonas aeruginosa]
MVGDDYHHIVRVMRMQPGDRVEIVFPDGKTAISEIVAITEDVVELTIVGWDEKVRELPVEVTIGISLLKKDNFDMVVQKGTELGASRFLPFHAERSVV